LSHELEGFWLPRDIRSQLLTPDTEYTTLSFADGRPSQPETPGAVTARWPLLDPGGWERLLQLLERNRARVPRGSAYWERLATAIQAAANRLSNPADPLSDRALNALPGYTGYSQAMIGFTLTALDMISLDDLPAAFNLSLTRRAARAWGPLDALPGQVRFYPVRPWAALASRLPGAASQPLFGPADPPDFVTGYGAGNVPGTALLIAFLAQAATLAGGVSPVTVIKNSRREPIFSPLILSALEAVDPDLFAAVAVLVWDYEDAAVQDLLLPNTDLAIAAASDESIAHIRGGLTRAGGGQLQARFHAHGHKVSFSAIGREMLAPDLVDPDSGAALLDIIPLLAALDSIFWDQHGCLSSRVHFVETGSGAHSPAEYAQRLSAHLGVLQEHLPRGAWPIQQLHDRFDRYKSLEPSGQVQVFSNYDDPFAVILDRRQLDPRAFYSQVNDCQGRVIVVRPVSDLLEIPDRYLRFIPPANLQSLSVALGAPGAALTGRYLRFAEACGARGVTAIRTVGRAAFPQLAYSWDGLLPLDLVRDRPPGYFTTIEFDRPYDQIIDTYRLLLSRAGGALS
jgi:hypothetical protein